MPIFNDTEHFYSVLVPFFNKLKDDPNIGPKIMASGLVIRFCYTEPDAMITIDCPNGNNVIAGPVEIEPTVTLTMKAIVAHRFWLGKVNLMVALTKREITAKGPLPALMKLLPLIKNAYGMYAEYLREIGMEDRIENWE